MYNLGMRNYFMQGIQLLRHSEPKSFFIFDEVQNKYVQIAIGAGKEGLANLEQVLDQLKVKRAE
jgi:hypothetical protein